MRPLIVIKKLVVIIQNGQGESPQITTEDQVREPQGQPEDTTGDEKQRHFINCKDCDWYGHYETELQAKKALGAHKRYCTGESTLKSPFSKPIR